MKQKLFILLILLITITGCNPFAVNTSPQTQAIPTKAIAIIPKAPTATNFPRIGTPTPIPPTATPAPTATPMPQVALFDDETLAELMAGTISSAGVESEVEIVDNRATGGQRIANITIVSEYNIEDSELLLKLFVLEVGNALRTIRAFSEGDMNADLDAAFLTVNDKQGNLLGTVSAPMPEIVRFLDGNSSVDEALAKLMLTGVFETFRK
jgi:hypothetical protein